MSEMLTPEEFVAMDTTVQLVAQMKYIIGQGTTRGQDLREMVFYIHGLQNMILSQAAARAYPSEFRLMGDIVE